MPAVPGLRSCYARVGRLVYFGRMLDKIRLHAAGKLPPDYHANLGAGLDGRTCRFLRLEYPRLVERVLRPGGSDEEILAWCHETGGARTDEECEVWCRFMTKLGWRDDRSEVLKRRIVEYGLADRHLPIETFFDLNDCDEGRNPMAEQAWLQ